MKPKEDYIYAVLRNGKPFRHFPLKEQAFYYLMAAMDFSPTDKWDIQIHVFEEED